MPELGQTELGGFVKEGVGFLRHRGLRALCFKLGDHLGAARKFGNGGLVGLVVFA